MRATLLGLIDYLVLLVLPGADMLLMDWVAVGRICKDGDYSPLQNIIALIANQRAISPTSILIKLKLNLMWVSCKSIKTLAPLLCFFVFLASETLQFPLLYHHRSHHQQFPCGGANESNDGFAGRTLRPLHWTSEPTIPTIFPSTFIPLYDFGCTISVMFDVAVKLYAFIRA